MESEMNRSVLQALDAAVDRVLRKRLIPPDEADKVVITWIRERLTTIETRRLAEIKETLRAPNSEPVEPNP